MSLYAFWHAQCDKCGEYFEEDSKDQAEWESALREKLTAEGWSVEDRQETFRGSALTHTVAHVLCDDCKPGEDEERGHCHED